MKKINKITPKIFLKNLRISYKEKKIILDEVELKEKSVNKFTIPKFLVNNFVKEYKKQKEAKRLFNLENISSEFLFKRKTK